MSPLFVSSSPPTRAGAEQGQLAHSHCCKWPWVGGASQDAEASSGEGRSEAKESRSWPKGSKET